MIKKKPKSGKEDGHMTMPVFLSVVDGVEYMPRKRLKRKLQTKSPLNDKDRIKTRSSVELKIYLTFFFVGLLIFIYYPQCHC